MSSYKDTFVNLLVKTHFTEEKDKREYDYEGDMAMSQLKSIINNAQKLHDMLEPDTNLPEWVQLKITLAEDYVVTAANYMEGEMNEEVEQIDEISLDLIRKASRKAGYKAADHEAAADDHLVGDPEERAHLQAAKAYSAQQDRFNAAIHARKEKQFKKPLVSTAKLAKMKPKRVREEVEHLDEASKVPVEGIKRHLIKMYGPGKVKVEKHPGLPGHYSATHETHDKESSNTHLIIPNHGGKGRWGIEHQPYMTSSYYDEEVQQVDEFVDRETRLAARKAETGSSTRVPSGDVLGRRGGHETPKLAIARRVGKDSYGIKSGGKTSIYNRSPKPNLPEEVVTEAKAVTHEDPLVTVHDKDGIMTHANLSTANHIHGTNVKHTDVHAGPVKVTNRDNNKMTFELSKNHAKQMKPGNTYKVEEDVELDEAQKKLKPYHWRAEWRLGTESDVDKNNKKIFDRLAKTDPAKATAFHDNLMRMKKKDMKEEKAPAVKFSKYFAYKKAKAADVKEEVRYFSGTTVSGKPWKFTPPAEPKMLSPEFVKDRVPTLTDKEAHEVSVVAKDQYNDVDKKFAEMSEAKTGTVPKTAKEKALAAKAHPKHLITRKDVLHARGVKLGEEELREKIREKLGAPGKTMTKKPADPVVFHPLGKKKGK